MAESPSLYQRAGETLFFERLKTCRRIFTVIYMPVLPPMALLRIFGSPVCTDYVICLQNLGWREAVNPLSDFGYTPGYWGFYVAGIVLLPDYEADVNAVDEDTGWKLLVNYTQYTAWLHN